MTHQSRLAVEFIIDQTNKNMRTLLGTVPRNSYLQSLTMRRLEYWEGVIMRTTGTVGRESTHQQSLSEIFDHANSYENTRTIPRKINSRLFVDNLNRIDLDQFDILFCFCYELLWFAACFPYIILRQTRLLLTQNKITTCI